AAPAVRFYQVSIGKFPLRILVEVLHVGVRGGAVDVEVILLHIFAVIALTIRQTEQALFEDGIAAIPKSDREAKLLLVIRDARQSVFSPAIGARARLVMTEIVPGISVVTVVLANRAPLPFAKIGSPFLPRNSFFAGLVQTMLLGCFDICHSRLLSLSH